MALAPRPIVYLTAPAQDWLSEIVAFRDVLLAAEAEITESTR